MRKKIIYKYIRRFLGLDELINLRSCVIELNDIQELKRVFDWSLDPKLDRPEVYKFRYIEDVNNRRLRDAECLGTVVRNINPITCLDIGTGFGYSAALMAINSPASEIYTINIPPEEFEEGGVLTTMKLDKSKIGSYFREGKFSNIKQLYANTATWEPDIGNIDIAFIDGSHDSTFVFNDTVKILKYMKPGSFILWHDFNLGLLGEFD